MHTTDVALMSWSNPPVASFSGSEVVARAGETFRAYEGE